MQYSGIIAFLLPALLLVQTYHPMPQEIPEINTIVELTSRQEAIFRAKLQIAYPGFKLRVINKDLRYFKLSIPNSADRAPDKFLDACLASDVLTQWQYDRKVQQRAVPNDPLWGEQWNLMQIAAEQAWERQTGGLTANGDTIVIAVLDAGFDIDQPDLVDVFWHNKLEIPGDGIDNDGNGYTDDHIGVYVETGNDEHPVSVHGTAVTGIIGASANNNRGISGINWQVKILPVSGIETESEIIEGYAYVKELRERYNVTNGDEGAYIVATNLSAGIDGEFAKDHPMWCAAYDQLGGEGVLNVAATSNRNIDVDIDGDMPSTCTSNFLITATVTDMADEKPLFAGYGTRHVDIGAPGTPLLTTNVGSTYEDFDGTSAAAPHITGAVGLLYSANCTVFSAVMRSDPPAAASLARSVLLQSVDANATLQQLVASGGRLNLYKALSLMEEECETFGNQLEIVAVYPNPARSYLRISYDTPDFSEYTIQVMDMGGREVLTDHIYPGALGLKLYELNTSSFAQGAYYLTLSGGNATVGVPFLIQ